MVRDSDDNCRLWRSRAYNARSNDHQVFQEHHFTGGQLIGAAASIAGIMVMAIPISMIVEKFAEAQDKIREQQERERKMSAV